MMKMYWGDVREKFYRQQGLLWQPLISGISTNEHGKAYRESDNNGRLQEQNLKKGLAEEEGFH